MNIFQAAISFLTLELGGNLRLLALSTVAKGGFTVLFIDFEIEFAYIEFAYFVILKNICSIYI